jgi:hypothetical protein
MVLQRRHPHKSDQGKKLLKRVGQEREEQKGEKPMHVARLGASKELVSM